MVDSLNGLRFEVDAIGLTYEAVWSGDDRVRNGDWTLMLKDEASGAEQRYVLSHNRIARDFGGDLRAAAIFYAWF